MAKEIQDTLGEVDEMPISESVTAGDERAADGPDDPRETNFEDEDEAVPSEAELQGMASDDYDDSAPTLALWLADELRPSPSKSLVPAAPMLESSETLAPVAVPPEELSEEDLAVLPPGSRPGQSRFRFARVALAGLGALAAIFLFNTLRRPALPEVVDRATAAEPAPGDPTLRTAAAPGAPASVASPTETAAEGTARKQLRYWAPSTAALEPDSDDPMRGPRGPSVGRFPDLPPEFWSEMRRRELESRAENAQPFAADPVEP